MVSTPVPRREQEGRGMPGNETHTDRRWRQRQKGGIQILKRPYYNLNNATHHNEVSSTSTKVRLDNEAPERCRPSPLNTIRKKKKKGFLWMSTRLALLEPLRLCCSFCHVWKATFMSKINHFLMEMCGPVMSLSVFKECKRKGNATTSLYIFIIAAQVKSLFTESIFLIYFTS